MANFTVSARIQQKTDTSANWTARNPVLLVGEIGIESDTGKLKVGNGINLWSQIAYIGITTDFLNANYLPKSNGTVAGYLAFTDTNSKITRGAVSPNGNNIGYSGIMLTHLNSDEGGLLITEDGAYLWNSSDSGSLLKILDEDVWTSNTGAKMNCTFANGLMFDFDGSGNLKIKGKLYQDNGVNIPLTSVSASQISVTQNAHFGNATTLQGVLDYIANVFAGVNTVTKLKANSFDTN